LSNCTNTIIYRLGVKFILQLGKFDKLKNNKELVELLPQVSAALSGMEVVTVSALLKISSNRSEVA